MCLTVFDIKHFYYIIKMKMVQKNIEESKFVLKCGFYIIRAKLFKPFCCVVKEK